MSRRGEPGLQRWLAGREGDWARLPHAIEAFERRRDHTAGEALAVIELYRSLGRDLSIARRALPASRITQALEDHYARLHSIIYRKPHRWRERLLGLFREEVPATMRELAAPLACVTLLFVLSAAAGGWLVMRHPELIALFASEQMINGVQQGNLWTEGLLNVVPSSILSIGILTNNIVVSLMAFCSGILFGLGTFYIIALNGLMLGGVFAFVHQHSMAGKLLEFVMAHGPVELSVICIAGAAGVMLGESLIRPGLSSRRESFQAATAKAGRVLFACALLLVGCGIIEGYVSPNPAFSMISRVVVGLGYWVVMVGLLSGRLAGRQPVRAR